MSILKKLPAAELKRTAHSPCGIENYDILHISIFYICDMYVYICDMYVYIYICIYIYIYLALAHGSSRCGAAKNSRSIAYWAKSWPMVLVKSVQFMFSHWLTKPSEGGGMPSSIGL